jgi:hypothetical protein
VSNYSNMKSEKARNYNDHDHYANNIEDVHMYSEGGMCNFDARAPRSDRKRFGLMICSPSSLVIHIDASNLTAGKFYTVTHS